jgi:hypothetical protein
MSITLILAICILGMDFMIYAHLSGAAAIREERLRDKAAHRNAAGKSREPPGGERKSEFAASGRAGVNGCAR